MATLKSLSVDNLPQRLVSILCTEAKPISRLTIERLLKVPQDAVLKAALGQTLKTLFRAHLICKCSYVDPTSGTTLLFWINGADVAKEFLDLAIDFPEPKLNYDTSELGLPTKTPKEAELDKSLAENLDKSPTESPEDPFAESVQDTQDDVHVPTSFSESTTSLVAFLEKQNRPLSWQHVHAAFKGNAARSIQTRLSHAWRRHEIKRGLNSLGEFLYWHPSCPVANVNIAAIEPTRATSRIDRIKSGPVSVVSFSESKSEEDPWRMLEESAESEPEATIASNTKPEAVDDEGVAHRVHATLFEDLTMVISTIRGPVKFTRQGVATLAKFFRALDLDVLADNSK